MPAVTYPTGQSWATPCIAKCVVTFEAALNRHKKTMKGTAKTFMRPQVLVKLCTKFIFVFLNENMAAQYWNPPDKSKAGKEEEDRIEQMSPV